MPTQLTTVAEGWESFREEVLKEMADFPLAAGVFKRCFYAGAMVFCTVAADAEPDGITELVRELHATMGSFTGKSPFDA